MGPLEMYMNKHMQNMGGNRNSKYPGGPTLMSKNHMCCAVRIPTSPSELLEAVVNHLSYDADSRRYVTYLLLFELCREEHAL